MTKPRTIYFVEILSYNVGCVVRRIGPLPTWREAAHLEHGARIQLDHTQFYTRIATVATEPPQQSADVLPLNWASFLAWCEDDTAPEPRLKH